MLVPMLTIVSSAQMAVIGQERTPTGRQRQQQLLSTRLPVLQKLDHGLLYSGTRMGPAGRTVEAEKSVDGHYSWH